MLHLGLSEVIILVIVFAPALVGVTIWLRASHRKRDRGGSTGPTP
jgi:hypothetical protein